MKSRIVLMVLAVVAALGPLAGPAAAQDGASPLLDLLATVPQAAVGDSELVTYGDMAAWHAATGIPRVPGLAALEIMPEPARAWWLFVMPRQTVPPAALGIEYLLQDEMRPAYGFDLFAVDRWIATDTPPSTITVLETGLEPARVGDALLATGYEAEPVDGGTLYCILDDYETALGMDVPRAGMLGALNRIVVRDDGTLVIARATALAQSALDAQQGAVPSLADDPRYVAAAGALQQLGQSDLGPLVGAIFSGGMIAGDPAAALLGRAATAETLDALRAQIEGAGGAPLPPYTLAAFGTYRGEGATSLALAVVFAPGTAAGEAADTLAARMSAYVSLVTGAPLGERWTFDRAFAADGSDLPVAVVVMRVADPPQVEGERPNTAVLAWIDLIYRRDLGFLVPGGAEGN